MTSQAGVCVCACVHVCVCVCDTPVDFISFLPQRFKSFSSSQRGSHPPDPTQGCQIAVGGLLLLRSLHPCVDTVGQIGNHCPSAHLWIGISPLLAHSFSVGHSFCSHCPLSVPHSLLLTTGIISQCVLNFFIEWVEICKDWGSRNCTQDSFTPCSSHWASWLIFMQSQQLWWQKSQTVPHQPSSFHLSFCFSFLHRRTSNIHPEMRYHCNFWTHNSIPRMCRWLNLFK